MGKRVFGFPPPPFPSQQARVPLVAEYAAWVPEEGFSLENGTVHGNASQGRWVDPVKVNSLFMFELWGLMSHAWIDPTEGTYRFECDDEGLLAFANRYGGLLSRSKATPLARWHESLDYYCAFMGSCEWGAPNDEPGERSPVTSFVDGSFPLPEEPTFLLDSNRGLQLRVSGSLNAAFAEAWLARVSGNQFIRCDVCEAWMEYVPEGGRVKQRYCSDRCRTAGFRLKKRRAHELKAAGMTPAKIAKELGSTSETVKGWLKKK